MAQIAAIDDLSPGRLDGFDAIIDARSPAEFAQDAIPGAINLPVLGDAERAAVGTDYVQRSAFLARRSGAALVLRAIAGHLEAALADRPAAFRPLIYCWRGGQRSHAFATVLAAVGWRVAVLSGGYKRWRREVVAGLADADRPLRLVLLDGQTGTAKTAILHRLAERGAQTLDLEAMAGHRGSVFGALAGASLPSQRRFETLLWDALRRADPDRPIVVEAESNLIGARQLPPLLWRRMKAAPAVAIAAPAPARAAYLVAAYADLCADPERILDALDRLAPLHARTTLAAWGALARAGRHEDLARELIERHYDPGYDRARRRRNAQPVQTIALARLDEAGIDAAATAVLALLETEPAAKRSAA